MTRDKINLKEITFYVYIVKMEDINLALGLHTTQTATVLSVVKSFGFSEGLTT
jgi:hypothetical protein